MFHWGRGGVSRQTRMGAGSSTLLKGSAHELIFFLSASWIKTRNKIFSEELPAWSNEYTHGQSGSRTRDLGVNCTNEPRGPREKRWREEKITEVNRQRETFTHVSCWLWLTECVWVHQQEVGRPSDDCRIPCWLLPLYFSSVRLEEITVRTDESLNCASFHSFYSD